jgi:hypothetical protein
MPSPAASSTVWRGHGDPDALQCAVDWGAFAVASESSILPGPENWLKQPD